MGRDSTMPRMEIRGSGALVAGGASGLGAATARRLAAAGANVTIADIDEARGAALAEEIGGRFAHTDVRDEAQVLAAVDRGRRRLAHRGQLRRHRPRREGHGLARSPPARAFERVIAINLIGTFNVLRLAATAMLANEPDAEGERGVVVCTASIAAFEGQVGQIAYAASKGGVAGMTLPAARDLAPSGIRVVTIAPGLFDTPLLAAVPEEMRERLGALGAVPLAPRPARGVRRSSSRRSSPTRCSTARRSGSTARCGWRRASRRGRRLTRRGDARSLALTLRATSSRIRASAGCASGRAPPTDRAPRRTPRRSGPRRRPSRRSPAWPATPRSCRARAARRRRGGG